MEKQLSLYLVVGRREGIILPKSRIRSNIWSRDPNWHTHTLQVRVALTPREVRVLSDAPYHQ